ncbi:SSR1 [Cordylochernes scorpioides]|uniref:Translocon-associated protein subunit alpha n=1 Tax=Cordylochernes scorpioides TaxID=51811 RepID=A0ABY6LN69_9ARAC|nr:SSR1 [Cordylochernes scorpioides]
MCVVRADEVLEDEEDVQVDLDEPPTKQPVEEETAAQPTAGRKKTNLYDPRLTLRPPSCSPDPPPPSAPPSELPAGKDVHLLVGFTHKGTTEEDFVVETLEASLRYALDFSFHIQNYSTVAYEQTVKPKQQTTLHYTFYPAEGFSSRPFGLVINLRYRDSKGQMYQEAVYNETITIVEVDEGLDGETFFLYVLLAGCGILVVLGGHHLASNLLRKKGVSSSSHSSSKPKVEMGTQNHNDVDYDWLPPETLNEIKNVVNKNVCVFTDKSPKDKHSPRQRKSARKAMKD